jgi:hypothetical protein
MRSPEADDTCRSCIFIGIWSSPGAGRTAILFIAIGNLVPGSSVFGVVVGAPAYKLPPLCRAKKRFGDDIVGIHGV